MRFAGRIILLLAGSVSTASAFFADPPFFDHTHSTGFTKRSRAASSSHKIYTNFDHASAVSNENGGATTKSKKPPKKPSDLASEEGRAILRERINIEISDDDRAVLVELKNKISEHMNPYSSLFDTTSTKLNNNIRVKGASATETDVVTASPPETRPDYVHIILFNPQTEQEGMHSIEYPKGSGNNLVLAFESKAECEKFSSQLTAEQFSEPVTYEMQLDTLEAYCNALGVFVQVVPTGMDLRPPNVNAPVLGHDPNLQIEKLMLDYLFDMAEMTGELDYDDSIDHFEGCWIDDLDDDGIARFDDVKGCWE